ncbi:MAG: four helix bundle protein [Gemmatimonadales bacterium]
MRSHRHLQAWQAARDVTLGVHRYGSSNWRPETAAAIEQLRRAALSVQLNLAEGFASGRGARCRHHFLIAYGSAVETTDILDLLVDLTPSTVLAELAAKSRETQALTLRLWQRSST